MLRLIVNPGTDRAWEIPLPPGVTTLGSDPVGGFPITHDTVSAAHCEVRVAGDAVTLKDLDSSCGTFVNHEPVREATLAPGQTLTLGEVDLLLTSDTREGTRAPGPRTTPPLPPPIPERAAQRALTTARPTNSDDASGPISCSRHPKALARWECGHCQARYCDLCAPAQWAGGNTQHLCRVCGRPCEPLTASVAPAEETAFFAQLPGAFGYPLKGNGVILLVGGVVFLLVVRWLTFLAGVIGFYGGIVAVMIALFGPGYLFNYCKCIIATTGTGGNAPPDWPDYTDWQADILEPLGQLIALAGLSLGPALILRWWQPVSPAFTEAATAAALGLGLLLAPMGMLGLAVFDSVAALNPVPLLEAIGRIPRHYLVAAAAFELMVGAYLVVGDVGIRLAAGGVYWRLLPVLALSRVPADLLGLYLLVVAMRILGLLYQADRGRLGWP